MEAANTVFYFITDKIIQLQAYFLAVANKVAYVMLLVAICTAAINYALTGTGLKESIVKIGKAFVFFSLVVFAYPRIVSWITDVTFTLAQESTYDGKLSGEIKKNISEMKMAAENIRYSGNNWTASAFILTEPKYNSGSREVLKEGRTINSRTVTINGKSYSYATVVPAYALEMVFLVAKDIFHSGDGFNLKHPLRFVGALVCGFFAVAVGCFAVLEYLIAFLEFMLVSSVGVILFPLSLWDGTKFIAEKYIAAMIGFFVKLLFSAICIFLMLWVYSALSRDYTEAPFIGEVEQIVPLFFTSLLVFYICKSAPALAQGLLSGSPSLSGAGAVGMVASAVSSAARMSYYTGSGQGVGGAQAPLAQASAAISTVSSGSGAAAIASQPPPQAFALPQPAPFAPSATLALPAQPYMSVEARPSDLTRSLAYSNRPDVQWAHPSQYL